MQVEKSSQLVGGTFLNKVFSLIKQKATGFWLNNNRRYNQRAVGPLLLLVISKYSGSVVFITTCRPLCGCSAVRIISENRSSPYLKRPHGLKSRRCNFLRPEIRISLESNQFVCGTLPATANSKQFPVWLALDVGRSHHFSAIHRFDQREACPGLYRWACVSHP